MSADDIPCLACPNCADDLIPAQGRGYYDSDGNYCEHRDGCRCHYCGWMWFDDAEPVTCACGAVVGVSIDDDHAYAELRKGGAR